MSTKHHNKNLHKAKKNKNDEFYTLYHDVEKEMQAYLEYDKNVFQNKTILLPCDDPNKSNFTKYFVANFDRLQLKKLVSTCYNINGGKGKILTIKNSPQKETPNVKPLEGNSDFRSKEIAEQAYNADIVITNPPFSLFREFIEWIINANLKYSVIGNLTATGYKEIFPLIKNGQMWLGKSIAGDAAYFETPDDTSLARLGNITWHTNIMYGNVNEPLGLMTMNDNLRYNNKVIKNRETKNTIYRKYDNYDGIEVPFVRAIPSDYNGIMGVPLSFLAKYNPKQFEIVGFRKGDDGKDLAIDGYTPFNRILIRHKHPDMQ